MTVMLLNSRLNLVLNVMLGLMLDSLTFLQKHQFAAEWGRPEELEK